MGTAVPVSPELVAARDVAKAWHRTVRRGKARRVPWRLQRALIRLERAVLEAR